MAPLVKYPFRHSKPTVITNVCASNSVTNGRNVLKFCNIHNYLVRLVFLIRKMVVLQEMSSMCQAVVYPIDQKNLGRLRTGIKKTTFYIILQRKVEKLIKNIIT